MDGHVYIFQSSNLRLSFPAFSFLLQTFPQMPFPLHQARTTPYQPSKAEPLLLTMTGSQCSLFFLLCLYALPFWAESCRHTKAYCQKEKDRQREARRRLLPVCWLISLLASPLSSYLPARGLVLFGVLFVCLFWFFVLFNRCKILIHVDLLPPRASFSLSEK